MVGNIVGELLRHVEIALLQIHLQTGQRPGSAGVFICQQHDRVRVMLERAIIHRQRTEVAQFVGFGFRFAVFDNGKPVSRSTSINVMRQPHAFGIEGLHLVAKGKGQIIGEIGIGHSIQQRHAGRDLPVQFRFALGGVQQKFISTYHPRAVKLTAERFHVLSSATSDQPGHHLLTAEIE
jgi:hypothetical protein